jgi:hypothetical protein
VASRPGLDRKPTVDLKIAGLSKIILSSLNLDLSLREEQRFMIFENTFQ